MNAHLEYILHTGLIRSYLNLDVSEMTDQDTKILFNEARRMVQGKSLETFSRTLSLFRDCTSVAAQLATIASLTARSSRPVLALTALSPLLDYLVALIPYKGKGSNSCNSV